MAGHTHVKRISGSHDHAHHHDSHDHSFHEEVVAIPPLDAADKNTDTANNSTEVELPIVLNFIVTPADKDERPVAANCEAHPTKQDLLKGLSTIVLELGILVHSLIIGITLGVSDDSRFKTLSVAICFHQLFEGMALGTLVSDTTLRPRDKVVLGLLYPLTTPMGVAVGIATRQSFNENASHTLLLRGIFNSLSAGILIYNTYCELVGGEINHNPGFERLSKSFKIACFLSMYLGATAMALLGVWA
ncbi:hypothetical protein HDU91_003698 [Kappamyces sp. JEL0680]|nr:hypothetical protein HDU91_003698 [Kappamyces sp. JEL0680]